MTQIKVEIYDDIGPSEFGMIDAKTVSRSIASASAGDEILVRINSWGGSANEGLAIYNILKSHPSKVHVIIDGVAVSAASLVAMAGDVVHAPKNSMMMIHDPWTIAIGDANEMQKTAGILTKFKDVCIETYLAKNKAKTHEQIAEMMSAETWMTGDEAVKNGFADVASTEVPQVSIDAAASASSKSRFAAMYRHAPKNFLVGDPPAVINREADSMSKKDESPDVAAKANQDADAAEQLIAEAVAKANAKGADDALAAKESERKRAVDIVSACAMAKKPELAAKFIEQGASTAEVSAALLGVLCKENAPSDDGREATAMGGGENAAYKAEYEANPFLKERMSFDEYVATRKIDDGKEPLQKNKSA